MSENSLSTDVERQMNELLDAAGLPRPDDVALLERAVVFLWYDTKAFVLIDLDGLPAGQALLDGFDLDLLRADILGEHPECPFPGAPPFGALGEGFAEAC